MNIFPLSVNNIPIRLTDERWHPITDEHSELEGMKSECLETISHPYKIYKGKEEECLAIREQEPGKYLVVVYRE